jgi:hypothetical protein
VDVDVGGGYAPRSPDGGGKRMRYSGQRDMIETSA